MTAIVTILRDGPDLVAGFTFPGSPVPVGFTFGARSEAVGNRVWVRCPTGDLMPLRAAIDWLQDDGHAVAGLGDVLTRKLGPAG